MVNRRVVFANPAAFDLFGVGGLDELAEREASRAHVLKADLDRIERRLAAIERGQIVSASVEYRIFRPDGTVRVVEWTTLPITYSGVTALLCSVDDVTKLAMRTYVSCEAAPIIAASGHVTGWISTATDLSAELSLSEELRASEARFRLLVEDSPDTVVRILVDPWRIGYMSPSVLELTGCSREQCYADPSLLAGFIHPDDLARVTDAFTAAGFTERFEYRLITATAACARSTSGAS